MSSQLDLDQGGTFRQIDRVWMGPSVGWQTQLKVAIQNITAAGSYNLVRGTSLIKLYPNGAVTLNLPSSLASLAGAQAIPGEFVITPVTIVDIGGFAGSVLYRIVPHDTELISGLTFVDLASPRGSIILEPLLDTGGWNLIQ
jgi:hypothetical protein